MAGLHDGAAPEEAALREGEEETGLAGLVVVGFLGEQVRVMADVGRDEVHHRFFYHLRHEGAPPERWRRTEEFPSRQGPTPRVRPLFELFWARLPEGVPPLIADHGVMLPQLVERLVSRR